MEIAAYAKSLGWRVFDANAILANSFVYETVQAIPPRSLFLVDY